MSPRTTGHPSARARGPADRRRPGLFRIVPLFAGVLCLVSTLLAIGCDKGQTRIPLSALAFRTAADETVWQITGMVRDAASHEPLSGIVVKLLGGSPTGPELHSTYTSGEGRFYFDDYQEGIYFLSVFHPDPAKYDPATSVITIRSDRGISPASLTIDLTPLSDATATGTERIYTITGTVRHATSREPLSGIIVKLIADAENGPELGKTYTSGEGRFFFENQKRGMYFLRFFHPQENRFDPATSVVTILKDGTVSPLTTEVTLAPSPPAVEAYTVHGKILDGYTGGALDFVKCSLEEVGKIMSDFLGNFFFESLVPGTYRLAFSKPGYEDLLVNFKVATGGVTFPSPLTYRLVQITEDNKGSIVGRIIDENTQQGIPGLVVRVYRMSVMYDNEDEGKITSAEILLPAVKSTTTAPDSPSPHETSGYMEAGSFRLTHLDPSTKGMKYCVYVGLGTSEIKLMSLDPGVSTSTVMQSYGEDLGNPDWVYSQHLVEVAAKTSTYITNYERP